jgi:hypothetical protein
MSIVVRRDFVKIAAAGVAAAFLPSPITIAQESSGERKPGGAVAELRGGSGSLFLEGHIAGGLLKLRVDDFIQSHGRGKDRALVAEGTFEASGANPVKLYRSYFSCNTDRQVFMRLEDGDHSSTLVFSESDGNIEYLTAWSGVGAPQQFNIDKKKYIDTRDAKASIVSGNADKLDEAQIGRRRPPAITAEEFENTFGKSPAFLEFNRGRKVLYQHAISSSFACAWSLSVKGAALFVAYWEN